MGRIQSASSPFARTLNRLRIWLEARPLLFLGIAVIVLVVFGAASMLIFESQNDIASMADALWYSFVTMTTVGYGDLYPKTDGGRFVGVILMLFGVGILGLFTGTMASLLVERTLRKDSGLGDSKAKDHFIICGWNSRAPAVVRELLGRLEPGTELVLIANLEQKPVDDERVTFIRGDFTDEEVLKRGGMQHARAVLVLAAEALGSAADAAAVLCALTIESINAEAYTCIELLDESNAQHCVRARADEVLVSGHMTAKMLAGAVLHPGSGQILGDLVTGDVGSTMHKAVVSAEYSGLSFHEALQRYHQEEESILIAIETKNGFQVNPIGHVLSEGEGAFLIRSVAT
ncbi:MAG: voltage-gated potassium channel [Planctomycetota bacterium]|jgi:voltage-gated potassium channel